MVRIRKKKSEQQVHILCAFMECRQERQLRLHQNPRIKVCHCMHGVQSERHTPLHLKHSDESLPLRAWGVVLSGEINIPTPESSDASLPLHAWHVVREINTAALEPIG